MDFWRGIACALLASYILVAAIFCAILYFVGNKFWKYRLKPALQYYWLCFSDDLSPFLVYCQIVLILFAAAIIVGLVSIATHLWPDFPVTATIAVWTSAIAYTLWMILKPMLNGARYQFESPMSRPLSDAAKDPEAFG